MKKIFFLLIACCIGFAASSQIIYQPTGTSSFTGANTYCTGAPITTPLVFTYTTCNSGTGIPTGATLQVKWYYNLTNSTSITGATLASAPVPFATATAATGSFSFTPSLSVGGNYYFFCEIQWSGGTGACGGASGSFVSSTTQLISISPAPIAPAAPINICQGNNLTLTNSFPGGTWVSSNPSVASIDTFTGATTGLTVGGTFITYKLGGCSVTAFMYVNATPPPITPFTPGVVCEGSTLSFANSMPGGTWTSSVPAVATVGATGVVSAFAAGGTTISYIISSTGCYTTKPVTVNPNPAAITGNSFVCVAGNTTLADATPGGQWVSTPTFRASVGLTTGIVNGVSAGTATISYVVTATGCYATKIMTVNTPPAAIAGPSSLCASNTMTLTNSVPGGTWSSSDIDTAIVGLTSGVVTGVAMGTARITYTTGGCTPVSKAITVNPLPGVITGVLYTCYGQTTALASTSPYPGVWKTTDLTIATVDTNTGVVSGLSLGVAIITYKVSTGCITTTAVTVHPLAPIVGFDTVCVGSDVALTNIVGGGTWVSSNPAVATIDTFTGIMSGLTNGITYIKYHLPTGCETIRLIETIPPLPPIGGSLAVCSNSTSLLSNGVTGGTWTSSNPFVAGIGLTTGLLSAHTADTATITYSVFGCVTTDFVTVNPLPTPTLSYDFVTKKLTTPTAYASYQWYNMSSGGLPIPGATSNVLVLPVAADSFYVAATDGNGCTGNSKWFKFPLGLNEAPAIASSINIFPNPAVNEINTDAPAGTRAVISSIDGKKMIEVNEAKNINISKLSSGMYLIGLYDSDGNILTIRKMIKE